MASATSSSVANKFLPRSKALPKVSLNTTSASNSHLKPNAKTSKVEYAKYHLLKEVYQTKKSTEIRPKN